MRDELADSPAPWHEATRIPLLFDSLPRSPLLRLGRHHCRPARTTPNGATPICTSPLAKARRPSIASRERVSSRARASISGSVHAAQSAVDSATTRQSSSLRFKSPGSRAIASDSPIEAQHLHECRSPSQDQVQVKELRRTLAGSAGQAQFVLPTRCEKSGTLVLLPTVGIRRWLVHFA